MGESCGDSLRKLKMIKPRDNQNKINYDQEKLKQVCETYGLVLVILHGSRVSGILHKESDVDIAILGNSKVILKSRLEVLSRLSDVFGDNVDVVFLNHAESMITYQVALKGVALYESSKGLFATFKTTAISRYQDANKFRSLERQYLDSAKGRKGT